MKKLLVLLLLLATPAYAVEQSAQDGCDQLLQAYIQLQVKAEQSELVSGVKQGIARICKKLIDAEAKANADKQLSTVDKKEPAVSK